MKARTQVLLGVGAAAGAMLAASVAAEVIVVKAEGAASARYRPGQRLADSAVIRLAARESVTIVGKAGTRVFRGAGEFRPSDPVRAGTRSAPQAPSRIGGFNLSSIEGGRSTPSQWVVMRASGPSARSYSPGRALSGTTTIALQPGDVVTLVGPQGTRVLRGPGTFRLAANTNLAAGRPGTPGRTRIGALGTPGEASGPPTIWHLALDRSGTRCFASSAVQVWRPDSSAATTLRIGRDGQIVREVPWPAGAASLAWPSDLPLLSGATYELREGAAGVPVRVMMKAMAETPADPVGLVSALLSQGCEAQANRVAEAIEAGGATGPTPAVPVPMRTAIAVDPDRGGTICLPTGAAIRLRRASAGPAEYRLASPTTRREAVVQLEDGSADWPGNMLIAENEEIEMRRAGAAATTRVRFRRIDATVAQGGDPVALAAALIERGCDSQLEAMVAATRVE